MLATRSQPSVGRELNGGSEARAGGGEGVAKAPEENGGEDAVSTMGNHDGTGVGEVDGDGSFGQPLKAGWTAHATGDGRVFYCKNCRMLDVEAISGAVNEFHYPICFSEYK
ncbi:hypothetical protein J437_LFUL008401 [Ladona fulva]|uniref:Uncharacterized protein n=1 Tax=Ladona fulva TaxID=123851 RepID=A0A8K0K3A2_LADFU|nr:hypothetical protein J437_LFUL008401 [Ladona fulva]